MATLKFYIRKGKELATIYTHLNISTNQKYRVSTGLYIEPKDWNERKGYPRNNVAMAKKITVTLQELERYVMQRYNDTNAQGYAFNKEWLKEVIDTFFNRNRSKLYFTDFIDQYIQTAPTRKNLKGGYGLSANRVQILQAFKKTFQQYEKDILKQPLTIDKITTDTALDFRDYFLSLGYSLNFVGGNLANFKTICRFIKDKDHDINIKTERIEPLRERKKEEDIITLSFEELDTIKNVTGLYPYLENARKWLLLGCEVGQRVSDLLSLSDSNLIDIEGVPVFKVVQQKTGKEVYIPLTPRAKEVIKDGMPRKICNTAFNDYIKELCRKAGINNLVRGRQPRTATTETQIIEKEKWEFVSSHVCRRSFATNYYGKVPTSTLKTITGHSTEEMFLRYIGKTAYNHAKEMIQAFKLLSE